MSGYSPVHDDDSLRAARMGWNALLNLRKSTTLSSKDKQYIDDVMDEMNVNGLFFKPGKVLEGPIRGDSDL